MSDKWDEQESKWNIHLSRLAEEVKLSPELIWGSRQQLISIFGQEWIDEQYNKHKIGNSILNSRGVVGVITNPIVNNAVGVVELAKYLHSVSHQSNFNDIVTKLKNADDYEAIRLNLAVGFRLKNIGWKDVIVEPELGDVEGIYNDQKYIVECGMFNPPNTVSKYLEVLFQRFHKYLKSNNLKTWLHIEFEVNPTDIKQENVLESIKKANIAFNLSGNKEELQEEGYKITIQELTPENLKLLEEDRELEEGSMVDVGYKLEYRTAKIPGDIYTVDLDDDSNKTDGGYITFGGVSKNTSKKSTEEQLKIKIKDKKDQTKNVPVDTRRMFVFQPQGMVEQEDIRKIGDVVKNGIKISDNIDDVIILDRRHQTAFDKLRYPSGQLHILTAGERVPHLEKMVYDMKEFEYSDWMIK